MPLLTEKREAYHAWADGIGDGRRLLHVAALSGLGLFVELLLIRYLDGQIRPLAYVKNLALIASFLGLGIGFALSRSSRSLYPAAVALLALALSAGSIYAVLPEGAVSGPAGPESNLGVGVAGALGGILLFSLTAALSIPPWVSALLALTVMLAYLRSRMWIRLTSALMAGAAIAGMALADHHAGSNTVWSPYIVALRVWKRGSPPRGLSPSPWFPLSNGGPGTVCPSRRELRQKAAPRSSRADD